MGIFARVLQDILIAHVDTDYSHLGGFARTDPIWHPLRRLGIAPETINRLKDAATSDDKRATLNPSDLEYAVEQLRFTPEEYAQLRAALLAQGVEIFLRERMTLAETRTTREITEAVYQQLLRQFEPVYDSVRDPMAYAASSDVTLDEALDLADSAGMLAQAAITARVRNQTIRAAFWGHIAGTAYDEIAHMVRSVEPALAEEFERMATKLRP